ncbi:MAG: hypothetical protein JSV03_03825 [Planctomycetota bacterium]|nr:MAG: hypothetical protein JSV03_03825 [Planctomycetota bacterium]
MIVLTVNYNKIRIISVITFVFIAGFISTANGGVPLDPPEIVGMKIIGRMGATQNWYTTAFELNGNYLYCACGATAALKTLDVSDPTNMLLISEWSYGGSGSQTSDLARKGNVLYLTNWSHNVGLRIFSLANPANPTLIRTKSTAANTWDIDIFGDLMYVVISNGLDPPDGIVGINVYDISDASNPVLLTFIDAGMRLVGNAVQYGDHLYFTSKRWLNVYDISNPSSPQYLRRFAFEAMAGTCRIRGNYLYMTASSAINYGDQGGLYTFSLADPANPQQVAYRAITNELSCFTGSYALGALGSINVRIMDLTNPADPIPLLRFEVGWPDTDGVGLVGDVVTDGRYAYVATGEDGNKPECPNFDTCPYFGARVYSVKAFTLVPPIIAEVTPDPDIAYIRQAYSKQLSLLQGTPLPTWLVVQAPTGTQVDNNGLVSGWIPNPVDIGNLFAFDIRATNTDGQDSEGWQVIVQSIANFDDDNDVDQEDFGWFQTCYTGSGVFPTTECEPADLDSDRDVDVEDFNIFQTCMSGPSNPPGC